MSILPTLSCEPKGFAFVSIHPTWAYPDGCGTVTLSGHGFSDSVSASIGDAPVENLTLPDKELDKGFLVRAVVPLNASGASGPTSVTLKSGSDSATLDNAFYYVDCPGPGHIETIDLNQGLVGGETITLNGCNFDGTTQQVQVSEVVVVDDVRVETVVASTPLVQVCRSNIATFAAPTVPAGEYYLSIVDSGGNQIFPVPCDTADTGFACEGITLSYGGAQ